jgi:hypothetical protein
MLSAQSEHMPARACMYVLAENFDFTSGSFLKSSAVNSLSNQKGADRAVREAGESGHQIVSFT